MSNMRQEQFEHRRAKAIDALKALHFDDDPHFIICVGNHEQSTMMICSCAEWAAGKAAEMMVNALDGRGSVTLDEGT